MARFGSPAGPAGVQRRRPRVVSVGRVLRANTAALAPALALLAVLAGAEPLAGQVFLTQDEALRQAFPSGRLERNTTFLDEAQLERARSLADHGVEIESGIVTWYLALEDGRPVGAAYFDAHRVRTLREVIMVVVEPGDRIRRIEVLKFAEPPEYLAPEPWLDQFDGETLDDDLDLKGDIVNLSGATLTSRAITRAARRVLALHAVIDPFGSGADAGVKPSKSGGPAPTEEPSAVAPTPEALDSVPGATGTSP